MNQDKELLASLANNPLLFEAVKKHLLSKFDIDDSWGMESVETIGQTVKARLTGKNLLNIGFGEISNLKTTQDKPSEPNPGR